jgi:GNAT superfamily N-acetyltransferase
MDTQVAEVIPRVGIEVKVKTHPLPLENVQKTIVSERIANGDTIFVAYQGTQPVGYIFASKRECWVGEIHDTLEVDPQEVYLYDAFTMPAFRGKRIFPYIMTEVIRYYRESKNDYALIFVLSSNKSSIRGIERAGFFCYQVVNYYDIFGQRVWNYKKGIQGVSTKFSNEN